TGAASLTIAAKFGSTGDHQSERTLDLCPVDSGTRPWTSLTQGRKPPRAIQTGFLDHVGTGHRPWSGSRVCSSRGTAGRPARPSALTCPGTTGNHSSRRPTLPATFAPAFYRPNPANRRRSEERVAQRIVGRERVRECEDDRLGTHPLGFGSGFIPCLPVQIGAAGMDT